MGERRKFDSTGHPCNPHNVTDDVWYYVEKQGVTICHCPRGLTGKVITLPWRKIKRALADHEKAKTRRPSPRGEQ